MEAEIYELRQLLKDVIETLQDRDKGVADWIEDRLESIDKTTQ